MTMDSQSAEEPPKQTDETEASCAKRSSPQLPSPAAATEPPKKRAAFSISSILGEDKTKRECRDRSISPRAKSPLSEDLSTSERRTPNKDGDKSPSAGTSPRIFAPIPPHDAAKYNAFLAHMANPELAAKMYRWPLFWNPWMASIQGAAIPAALPRPPFLQHSPIAALSPEGLTRHVSNRDDDRKIEAGEIVRPVACRRGPGFYPSDSPGSNKHHFNHSSDHAMLLHETSLANRSPSPVTSIQRQPIGFQLRASQQHGSQFECLKPSRDSEIYSKVFDYDAEKDNDMVEIEIEGEISDNDDTDDNNASKDEDGFNKSNCERKKKTRTVFSRSQIFQLETMFDMKRYLSSSERAGLAKALNMTETQVKIWFQNRRNKWKRQIAAEMEAANMNQVTGQRLMQLPYMYSHDELNRASIRSSNMPTLSSLPAASHPVVPPSVHHYYGGILRAHTS